MRATGYAGRDFGISLPGQTLRATVRRTAGSLDPKTRTLLAEVEIPNRDHSLLPGSYVAAKVTLEVHKGVTSLPSAAVGSDKSGKFLFLVAGGKAKRIPVTTGFDNGTFAEISRSAFTAGKR